MGSTIAQKILARKSSKDVVSSGEIVFLEPDLVMTHDHQGPMTIKEFDNMGVEKVWNSQKIVVVIDHRTPTQSTIAAENHQLLRKFVTKQGIEHFFDVGEGICHDLLVEKGFAKPGQLIIATDSHTVTAGALGCFATGVGSSEMATIWASGELWLKVPETIKVKVKGTLNDHVGGKDVSLKLLDILKTHGATYKAIEFHGEGMKSLNLDERMSLCCMCLEMGAKAAIVVPDEVTDSFLVENGIHDYETFLPDKDAEYVKEIEIDLSVLKPLVACPFSPDNVTTAEEIAKEHIQINQVIIGTCTNGRITDLRQAAKILENRKVKKGVRMLIVPGTKEILNKALNENLIKTFIDAGAMIGVPSCGPCGAYGMGAMSGDEVCVTTGSRNFVGRLGAPDAKVYLSSASTAAASAITGEVNDPIYLAGGSQVR